MSYSTFRKRMSLKGNTAFERSLNQQKREFELYFNNTINREMVKIDGIEQPAVFQDVNQNNNKDLSDDKYIITENDSNMKVGSYVEWRDKTWMVFTEEYKTINSHKQAKMKSSNQVIKWMVDGKVCGDGNGVPAFIQNQTLYTLGVSTSGYYSWIVNGKMMMYMQNNRETMAIKIGQRIFIGGMVFQVMFKDNVSRKGLINYLLEQDFVNPERDNIELEIADYYDVINPDKDVDEKPSNVAKEVIVSGADNARIGALVQYEAKIFHDGTEVDEEVDWTIADIDSSAEIVERTANSIKLRIVKDFRKVGLTINVVATSKDGTVGSKTVRIVSPY
ncbi:hypothetical protein MHI17_31455 [Bacillus sp. FSL L8-0098]|uniref:hypothetical protein n=2 Tax=unclassified Bacillus (in: firmicutes) TaxID=185979 RepID=UPI0030F9799A